MISKETLILSAADVRAYARTADVVDALEAAFAAYERGDAQMPAKSYVDLPRYDGDFRSMPAYLDTGEWDAAGIKWVNVHPNNPAAHDLPTVMGTVVYTDPETGFPLAIVDGTEVTMQRTGAAAAVATDHLAVDDATSLGIVGAGVQSYSQLEAIAEVRPIEEVVVSDVDDDAVDAFVETFGDEFDVRAGSVAEAGHCDVLSTVTPVREPIVSRADVADHTHVNAMGADAEGKRELDDELIDAATIVIDDHEQCTHSGEINVPYAAGTITDADIHAELGSIVLDDDARPGADAGITVFDSTGLAIQDIAAAHVVYATANERTGGTSIELTDR